MYSPLPVGHSEECVSVVTMKNVCGHGHDDECSHDEECGYMVTMKMACECDSVWVELILYNPRSGHQIMTSGI